MNIEQKYADLLINYSLEIKKGEKLYIRSSIIAESLVREIYELAIKKGAYPEVSLSFEDKDYIFYNNANHEQLQYVSPILKKVYEEFDAILTVRADFNKRSLNNIPENKKRIVNESHADLKEVFGKRSASGELKWSLCQYPTSAAAQEAGMSLKEYTDFIYNACFLNDENPVQKWKELSTNQQKIADFLNKKSKIRYVNEKSDIEFESKDRIWINSDGKRNMPSGEVFTSPIENSVNGVINFTYPGIYLGQEIENITLEVEDGKVINASAEKGESLLKEVLNIKNADHFGECAIGTNYGIDKFTKNTLFDEKIGGTIHMALGNSYYETGGKNKSSIHWDLITDMTKSGKIYADDELIYENGKFILEF